MSGDLPTAQDVVDAITALHSRTGETEVSAGHSRVRVVFCVECSDSSAGHRVRYPCPTLRAALTQTVESTARARRVLS